MQEDKVVNLALHFSRSGVVIGNSNFYRGKGKTFIAHTIKIYVILKNFKQNIKMDIYF